MSEVGHSLGVCATSTTAIVPYLTKEVRVGVKTNKKISHFVSPAEVVLILYKLEVEVLYTYLHQLLQMELSTFIIEQSTPLVKRRSLFSV